MTKNMENSPQQFSIENSPMREAYELLGAKTPLELHRAYSAEDQRLMKSHEWDYANPDLLVNKIKDILEKTDEQMLTDEEKEWKQSILWFWYHHAISCAIWRYKDKEAAKLYATKALEFQADDNPNKITRLLWLLVDDKLEEAEAFAASIPQYKLDDGNDNPEPETARELIESYKQGGFR